MKRIVTALSISLCFAVPLCGMQRLNKSAMRANAPLFGALFNRVFSSDNNKNNFSWSRATLLCKNQLNKVFFGCNLLHAACGNTYQNPDEVKRLIELGINPNELSSRYGGTALHFWMNRDTWEWSRAIEDAWRDNERNANKVFDILIDAGGSINAITNNGFTPLDLHAIKTGRYGSEEQKLLSKIYGAQHSKYFLTIVDESSEAPVSEKILTKEQCERISDAIFKKKIRD